MVQGQICENGCGQMIVWGTFKNRAAKYDYDPTTGQALKESHGWDQFHKCPNSKYRKPAASASAPLVPPQQQEQVQPPQQQQQPAPDLNTIIYQSIQVALKNIDEKLNRIEQIDKRLDNFEKAVANMQPIINAQMTAEKLIAQRRAEITEQNKPFEEVDHLQKASEDEDDNEDEEDYDAEDDFDGDGEEKAKSEWKEKEVDY